MDEVQMTAEAMINLDEPEAMVSWLARIARKKATLLNKPLTDARLARRWDACAKVLEDAERKLPALIDPPEPVEEAAAE